MTLFRYSYHLGGSPGKIPGKIPRRVFAGRGQPKQACYYSNLEVVILITQFYIETGQVSPIVVPSTCRGQTYVFENSVTHKYTLPLFAHALRIISDIALA